MRPSTAAPRSRESRRCAGIVTGTDRIKRLTGASLDDGDGSLELTWVVVPLVVAACTAGFP
jgi:hypothetical protein